MGRKRNQSVRQKQRNAKGALHAAECYMARRLPCAMPALAEAEAESGDEIVLCHCGLGVSFKNVRPKAPRLDVSTVLQCDHPDDRLGSFLVRSLATGEDDPIVQQARFAIP